MVKFTKQFEGQLIPEWKEAFVDYWQLKKYVKKIHCDSSSPTSKPIQKSSLTNSLCTSLQKLSLFGNQRRDREFIHVHSKVAWTSNKGVLYQTELLEQSDHNEAASAFFALLDLQLNKVNEFYLAKEKAFLDRGECLQKQLHILVELKTALKDKQKSKANSSHHGSKDEVTISGTISCDEESNRGVTDQILPDEETITEDMEKNDMQSIVPPRSEGTEEKISKMEEGQSLSGSISNCHGKNLKIRIPLTNPTRAFSYLLWEDLINQSSKKHNSQGKKLHINKTKLHHAEKIIRGALVELYKGLGYLKTYRNLNMLAFIKILKKFDKVNGVGPDFQVE